MISLPDRSIVPACDVESLDQLTRLVRATRGVERIHAYKVGFSLALRYGLPAVVERIKGEYTGSVVVYDHQKAGTDIPDTGKTFARTMVHARVDAAILFPRSRDPVTQYRWTQELLEARVLPIIGGELTHRPATPEDEQIYWDAAKQAVRNFVVPGNKPERVRRYREVLVLDHDITPIFWSPGLVAQGGTITEAGEVAGGRFHAIVGRGLYNPKNKEDLDLVTEEEIHTAALDLVKALKSVS